MESSFEKAERGRAGIQIAIWNDTKSWLGPIREYARISTAIRSDLNLEPSNDDATERRLRFFGWEAAKVISTALETSKLQKKTASELLNSVFFQDLGFSMMDSEAGRRPDPTFALFETILARRTGPSTVLAMLYAWVGEMIVAAYNDESDFLRIELVNSAPTEVVRIIPRSDLGKIWLVDIAKTKSNEPGGDRICDTIWSTWCATSTTDGFARLSWSDGLLRCLGELQNLLSDGPLAQTAGHSAARLFVIDRMIALQPSDTARWAERAVLNARRGDRALAYDDLKRFFAFHERHTVSQALVALYDELHTSLRPESNHLE